MAVRTNEVAFSYLGQQLFGGYTLLEKSRHIFRFLSVTMVKIHHKPMVALTTIHTRLGLEVPDQGFLRFSICESTSYLFLMVFSVPLSPVGPETLFAQALKLTCGSVANAEGFVREPFFASSTPAFPFPAWHFSARRKTVSYFPTPTTPAWFSHTTP
jgi:hypothetical protein